MRQKRSLKIKKDLNSQELFDLCKENLAQTKANLKKQFLKMQGKSFGSYQSREIDGFIKSALNIANLSIFNDFMPSEDKLPFCILALGSYARNELSVKSDIHAFVVYKNIQGYNVNLILESFFKFLDDINLELRYQICEVDEIFQKAKDNLELKSFLSHIRFVCGSKHLYREIKLELIKLKNYKKDEFIKHYLETFKPYNDIKFLTQEPDLKQSYGGINEINSLYYLLNYIDENPIKYHILKFIDEKELSEINLSIDYLTSIRSALHLSGGENELKFGYLESVSKIMQTKEKKMLDTQSLVVGKVLSSMHTIAIYTRFLAFSLFPKYFKTKLTFLQRKLARLNSGYYIFENTIYTPLHKKTKSLENAIKDLNLLPDMDLKFDITTIFHLKRTLVTKSGIAKSLNEFKKLFYKNHSFGILKALLNSEILFVLIKPMAHTRHLAAIDGYHTYSVDEHSILGLFYLENIEDKFIKSLYQELCKDTKMMLKLVLLMHDVGKGFSGDHSAIGSNIFRAYATKLGLNPKLINIGVTLIKYHTLMVNVANREDIYNERVILSFISKLGDKQILKLLYILTYCDMKSTQNSLYNSYSSKLLRELYDIAMENFDDENLLDEATRRLKKEGSIRRHKDFLDLSKDEQELIFQIPSNLLFVKYQPAQIIKIALFANKHSEAVEISNSENLTIEIITKRGTNMASVLNFLGNLNLAYMEIYDLFAKKVFVKLEYNDKFGGNLDKLKSDILVCLNDKQIPNLQKPTILESEINLDLEHSQNYAKLSINAKDQRGLMAYFISLIEKFEITIANGRIQTIKNRTRNLFLIQKTKNLIEFKDELLKLLKE